jgi:hypothetical protein
LFALDRRTASLPISSSVEEPGAWGEGRRRRSEAPNVQPGVDRRFFLTAAVSAFAAVLSGCGGAHGTTTRPPPPPLPPLVIPSLDVLVPLPGLRWLVVARPNEIAKFPWLEASIAMVIDKDRLERFPELMGFDLRAVSEATWAAYRTEGEGEVEDTSFQLVRHTNDPLVIERLFRDRLSTDVVRSVDDPRVVRASGRIGKTVHAFAAIGRDVVAFQQDGIAERGPCRVAALLALGKLKRTKPVFDDEALRALSKRLESAPLRAFAPGPFEGELGRGARGLLAAATAVGAGARPSPRESVLLEIAVAGDFTKSGDEASRKLAASWDDLASRPFGHLLGLDAPLSPAFPSYTQDAVALVVDLDPRKLAKGLADATSNQIREIMR